MKKIFENGYCNLEVYAGGILLECGNNADNRASMTYSFITGQYKIERANDYEMEKFKEIVKFFRGKYNENIQS